jgi:hypothetical protein
MAAEALIWPPLDQTSNKVNSGLILDKKRASSKGVLKPDEDGLYGYLGHVISWHDLTVGKRGNFRVFVHSLARSNVRRDVIAVEIEKHATFFMPIEQPEAQARLNLAYARSTWITENAFNSSLFRELPSGRVLEDHAREIDGYLKTLSAANPNVVSLFENVLKQRKPPKGGWKFSSTQKDSILLAKLYAIRSQGGTERVGKRICEELGIETSVLYTAIRVARSKGWLAESRKGITGGTMTAEGEEFFLANDGPARLEQITGIKLGK